MEKMNYQKDIENELLYLLNDYELLNRQRKEYLKPIHIVQVKEYENMKEVVNVLDELKERSTEEITIGSIQDLEYQIDITDKAKPYDLSINYTEHHIRSVFMNEEYNRLVNRQADVIQRRDQFILDHELSISTDMFKQQII